MKNDRHSRLFSSLFVPSRLVSSQWGWKHIRIPPINHQSSIHNVRHESIANQSPISCFIPTNSPQKSFLQGVHSLFIIISAQFSYIVRPDPTKVCLSRRTLRSCTSIAQPPQHVNDMPIVKYVNVTLCHPSILKLPSNPIVEERGFQNDEWTNEWAVIVPSNW